MQRKTSACNSGEEGHATKITMGGNSIVVLWDRVYKTYLYLRFRTFLVWFCLAVLRFRSNSSMLLLIKRKSEKRACIK